MRSSPPLKLSASACGLRGRLCSSLNTCGEAIFAVGLSCLLAWSYAEQGEATDGWLNVDDIEDRLCRE